LNHRLLFGFYLDGTYLWLKRPAKDEPGLSIFDFGETHFMTTHPSIQAMIISSCLNDIMEHQDLIGLLSLRKKINPHVPIKWQNPKREILALIDLLRLRTAFEFFYTPQLEHSTNEGDETAFNHDSC